MNEPTWSHLTPLQVGRFAEHFITMELVRYGLDVYRCEIDDRGIDFVIRFNEKNYVDLQVKAVRDRGYIFFRKDKFHPRPNLIAAVVIMEVSEALEELWEALIPRETYEQKALEKKLRTELTLEEK